MNKDINVDRYSPCVLEGGIASMMRNPRGSYVLLSDIQCATPPSPSTAPEVDERAEFEAWSKRVAPVHEIERDSFDQYVSYPVHAGWAAWQSRAALASRPAEVDDDPPQWWHELQAAAEALDDAGAPLNAESVRKIAEQYRQGQRDAVAADRARRVEGGKREVE